MPSERVERCLSECAVLVRNTVSPDACIGKRYIALEHIEEGTLRLLDTGKGEVVTSAKSEFRMGDILFGKLRPYFRKVVRPKFDGVCSTDIWVVRAAPDIDQGFLYYWMASKEFVEAATRGSTGTKMPRADWDFVGRLTLPIPPLPTQRRIASILGALDDKIEVNRKQARVLEGIARAVFTSWFVDFDPVRRKAAGEPTGLPDEIAALFPDRLVDSPMGEAPEGWAPSRLAEHFNLTMGQSPPGSTYNETGDGLPFYQGRTDYGFRFPTPRVYCTAPTRFAEPGDALVSVRAPVGDVNMAIERCAVGRGVAAVRHKSGSCSLTYYAMHALRAHFLRFEADGTVFGAIGKADFERLPFVAPPPASVAAFEQFAGPLDQRIEGCERQSVALVALRDALLPKFLSGKLEVPAAEAAVEEVTA